MSSVPYAAVDQRGSEQIEYRADQREKHVAQGRLDRLLIAFETDKRHGGKGQQFERDVEIEKIGADGDRIQAAPDA